VTLDERRRTSLETIERQILSVRPDHAALTADGLDRLRAMVTAHADAVHLGRIEAPASRGHAERSAKAVSDHLVAAICPVLLARFCALLPIVGGETPGRSTDEASATDYADAIATVFSWESVAGPDTRLRAAIQDRLAAITRTCRLRIEQHLRVGSDQDFPDVRLLARDILRVEAVEWAVSVAGGASRAADLRHLAHHAARQAVQWAGRVFDRFKMAPDEFTHFDAVATLSAVDDLLVVILRVLESDRDDRLAGSHPFVLTLGEQALQDFVDGLERMTGRYLDIAEANLLADGAAGAFVLSVLQLLRRVLRLEHALLVSVDIMEVRLNHEATLKRLVALRDWLRASLAQPGAPKGHAVRLAEIEAALADIGA
jgi:hypothetical protein